jgi:hypothetical protein
MTRPPDSTNLIAALEGVHASVFRRLVESVSGARSSSR